ncbi:MAG: sulfate adenylyltransferase small subunit, partial [Burkholderiales bacterium]
DVSCTCPVASLAANADDVIVETIGATASERGATRMDDRANDSAMERRKKEGYF